MKVTLPARAAWWSGEGTVRTQRAVHFTSAPVVVGFRVCGEVEGTRP